MIVVDSSALVAIVKAEPDWQDLIATIQTAPSAHLSSINYVETGIVLIRRGYFAEKSALDSWLRDIRVQVREDLPLWDTALTTYLRYGRGIHPAGLNLADCFAYALASSLNAPLLFKGDDFAQTDIASALYPT